MRRNTILSLIIAVVILSFTSGLVFSAGRTNSNALSLSGNEIRDIYKYLQKYLNELLKKDTGGDDSYQSVKT